MEKIIITNFDKFDLTPEMMRGLAKMNFKEPSPVQDAAIAPMLRGIDVLVQAPTGTGKTAAFGIPVLENVNTSKRDLQTVILCPTRELAQQIVAVLKQLAAYKAGIRIAALYGGEPIQRQIIALKRKPQIVVATPGRIMDHISRRTVRLNNVDCVVLDEADRMLDMGFRDDINTILESAPEDRQTVLFSATLSNEIKKIAAEYQRDAEQICIQQETLTVDRVEQYYCEIHGNAKTPTLINLLSEKKFGLSIVFVATKAMADKLAKQLTDEGHPADAIHGDLRQSQRNKVMQRYRDQKIKTLVATDVAARGIDVDGIDAVINYDIPSDSDSYVHRIGRTGRAGCDGIAYTFIYPRERSKLQAIISDTKATILPEKSGQSVLTAGFKGKGGRPAARNGQKRGYNGKPRNKKTSFARAGA